MCNRLGKENCLHEIRNVKEKLWVNITHDGEEGLLFLNGGSKPRMTNTVLGDLPEGLGETEAKTCIGTSVLIQ